MLESTAVEQNIEKRMKSNVGNLETSGTTLKSTNIHITGISERKERAWENIWRDKNWKFPNMGKEIVT